MTRFALALLTMFAAGVGCEQPASNEANADVDALTFHGAKLVRSDRGLPDIDVLAYDFDLDAVAAPTPSNGALAVSGSVTVTLVTTRALASVSFDYTGQGSVRRVRLGSTILKYEKRPNRLDITLAKPVPADTTIALQIEFSALPEREVGAGERTRGLTFDSQRELFSANWPNRARQWFPCKDNPRDAAMFASTIRTPVIGDSVISNGKTTTRVLADGRRTTVHEMLHPIPTYAFFLGISNNWTREVSAMPDRGELITYLEGTDTTARAAKRNAVFASTGAAYTYFSTQFGAYAWETLKFVEVPTTWGGGGMEHVGAISIDPREFATPNNARITMVHELAHQWSGDLVRIKTWNDFWLSEGLTEYLTRRFVEDHDGVAAATILWNRSIAGGKRATHPLRPGGDLETDPTPHAIMGAIFDNVAYDKGAWVLRVLEQKVGRAKFTAFLRSWFQQHQHEAVGTDTFERELAAFAGQDFSAFFQQAVYGTATPE
jgi:aminopeptidase N